MIPKISVPTYELTIPSSGKKIKVRPFLVKEEKLLLTALESGEEQDIINTTKQIVQQCILDDDVNVEKMPFFDVDYLFIALRAKSVGEFIEIKFKCEHVVDGELCGAVFPAQIDASKVEVKHWHNEPNEVLLPDQVKVVLKYPSYTQMKIILDDDNDITKKIRLIVACIDSIHERDNIITLKDTTPAELTQFIEGLTQDHFSKFEKWVDYLPSFILKSEATCSKCGFNHKLEYTDFTAFFESH